jgi:hypothetical protein
MLKKVGKAIKNPKIILSRLLNTKLFWNYSDDKYLQIKFRLRMGKKLDLQNPITFNEKLQWLKLYDRNPSYTQMVDKYEVRKYISRLIGNDYLIPLLGVYDKFDEINFDELPSQFVLKCTHDSGGSVICTDKAKFDIKKAKKKINKFLKRNFYYQGREWCYKNVKPRIICEKYMVDESGTELKDYKFMCFNGKAKCLFVCLNRNLGGLNVDFYDMNWNRMPFERHYPSSNKIIKKPINFNMMVAFAEKISKDMPFARIDFYEVNGRLYFGEITFYPGNGFEEFSPEVYDELLGDWISLPCVGVKI